MSNRLETLSETATIFSAAELMREAGVGFLPICDVRGRVIGVVTDRDLVIRATAQGLDPKTTSAAMIMTSPALTCLADADLRATQELMARERTGRIVVTSDDGAAVGVVSLADVIEHAPGREALRTARAVLWREALGPRGGAAPGQRLLKDYPLAREAPETDQTPSSVFTGGQHDHGTKEFPT
jgi:CBS-domain-containing membrane protein